MSHELCAKQVSVFMENRTEQMAEACSLLGAAGVSLRALSTACTSEFGVLRFVSSDPAKARQVLDRSGWVAKEVDVLAVGLADRSGEMARVLETLSLSEVTVEYLYAAVTPDEDKAVVILRVPDERITIAVEALQAAGLGVLAPDRVYAP